MKARGYLPFVLVMCASFASAQSDHSKAFWVKKYNGIAKMFATKNMDAFEATLDPIFSYLDKGGMHDRKEFVENEIEPVRAAKRVGGTVKVLDVKTKGEQVFVSYDWKYWMILAAPKGDMRITGREIGTDNWRKVNGKWLTLQTVIKSATSSEEPVKKKR